MSETTSERTLCWMDGKIGPASEARIPVLDHGFLFGDGVFEGIRVTPRGIFRFPDHMKRLETAARAIGLVVPGASSASPTLPGRRPAPGVRARAICDSS